MENTALDTTESPGEHSAFENDFLFSQDSVQLRQILPETVWRLVAEKLTTHPASLSRLADSSLYFRDLLSSRRTLFLFEDAFYALTTRLWKTKGRKGFPFANVLKCREVCSVWNCAVDKNIKERFPKARLPNRLKTLLKSKLENVFDASMEQVFDFLTHFEDTHDKPNVVRNPFIWNNLSVITINDENEILDDDQQHLDAVSLAIRKYGRFIHEFKLEIGGGALYVEDALKLQDWLAHMPNLRSLEVLDDTEKGIERHMTLADFEAEMVAVNFPPFKKLNHLKSVRFKGVRAPIFNRFIQQNHHISKLFLSKFEDEYDFFTLSFENLTSFDTSIGSVEMFEKLKASSQVQWPILENLSIFFRKDDNYAPFVPLSDIFQVIEAKFANKLDTIYLEIPKATTAEEADCLWRDSVNCRLNLPNLLGARLSFYDPISLDFLLGRKDMLESMLLDIRYPVPGKKNSERGTSIVRMQGFEKKILASNIPKLFTNLDRIGVSFGFVNGIKWHDL